MQKTEILNFKKRALIISELCFLKYSLRFDKFCS